MQEDYVIRDQEKAHFITATVVDWIYSRAINHIDGKELVKVELVESHIVNVHEKLSFEKCIS